MEAVYRRRRIAAAAIACAVVLAIVVLARGCGADDGPQHAARRAAARAAAGPPPAQLPRGGRTILPGHRVVAIYGAPQDPELGTLGIGTPDQAGRRLVALARRYARLGPPVLPAMELLATVAAGDAGEDGMYRMRQQDAVIARYLRAARRVRALLVLDIQPGRSDFLKEAMALRRWLAEPDVSLALDPEWRVDAPDVPARVIGSVSAQEVNAVSFWLDRMVRDNDLPQKLLLVHRFTHDMIRDQQQIKRRRGLAITMNVDGFGARAVKVAKYEDFARARPRGTYNGFKLFYEEDTGLMRPREVARLRPRPRVVVYE
jgi:hypothetical protein